MTDVPVHTTHTGHRYYENTLPGLVRRLDKTNRKDNP